MPALGQGEQAEARAFHVLHGSWHTHQDLSWADLAGGGSGSQLAGSQLLRGTGVAHTWFVWFKAVVHDSGSCYILSCRGKDVYRQRQ